MREIHISNVAGVNLEALDEGLRALPGAPVVGISLRRGALIVHLETEADDRQADAIRSLVNGHDPQQPSAAQQARKTREAQLKSAHDDALAARQAAAGGGDLSEQVALLTRRIDWLEKALEALVAGEKTL
ncbi:MAG: hypothetical protein OXF63_11130 [Anaerolineaceae bacterium]|nr:hypothetical protein [Anaerolineaceae bacterium]